MPRNSSGVVRSGRRSFAIHGGTLEDHGIVRAEILLRPIKVERNGALALKTDGLEAFAEPNWRASRGKKAERRVDEASGKAVGGEQRVAGLTPRGEGFPQQSARSAPRNSLEDLCSARR